MSKAQANVKVQNPLGLHARPAMSFVDKANTFVSDIRVRNHEQEVDGKSIMQMMMLGATQGTELAITAQGPDAAEAIQALSEIIELDSDEPSPDPQA